MDARGTGPGGRLEGRPRRPAAQWTQAREVIDGLGPILADTLDCKLRLGAVLADARGRCKAGGRGLWTAFLTRVGIAALTAREAIRFHRKRARVRRSRCGRIGSNIEQIRIVLAEPRADRSSNGEASLAAPDEHDAASPGRRPSGGPGKEPHEGSGGGRDRGRGAVVEEVEPIAPLAEDDTDQDASSLVVELCQCIAALGKRAVAALKDNPSDEVFESLREWLSRPRETLDRLTAALTEVGTQADRGRGGHGARRGPPAAMVANAIVSPVRQGGRGRHLPR